MRGRVGVAVQATKRLGADTASALCVYTFLIKTAYVNNKTLGSVCASLLPCKPPC